MPRIKPDRPPPTYSEGLVDGYRQCEHEVRMALQGHKDSELWGEHGLLAATMRVVMAAEVLTDNLDRKEP